MAKKKEVKEDKQDKDKVKVKVKGKKKPAPRTPRKKYTPKNIQSHIDATAPATPSDPSTPVNLTPSPSPVDPAVDFGINNTHYAKYRPDTPKSKSTPKSTGKSTGKSTSPSKISQLDTNALKDEVSKLLKDPSYSSRFTGTQGKMISRLSEARKKIEDKPFEDGIGENEEQALKIIKQYKENFPLFASKCINIRDHNTGKIVKMNFNRGQQILHNIAEKQSKETGGEKGNGKVRILLLKSRRFGGSTYVESRFYFKTSTNFNRNTFIVAHEDDSTNTLFQMANLMQELNPLAPSIRKSNAKELIFDIDRYTAENNPDAKGLKSQYRLATARNVDAGKSQGIHYLHLSEEAMYQGGGYDLLGGLFQCVPPITAPVETEIFRESTAKGYGNSFQEDVFKTYLEGSHPYYQEDGITYAWHNPDSNWALVFIPWFVFEWYTYPFDSLEQKARFKNKIAQKVFNRESMQWEDSEELRLSRKFGLTLEQLHWREWCIENQCRGSVDIFNQEYPATVTEAFLSSGFNVFSPSLCDTLEANTRPPILTGDLIDRYGKTKIKPNRHGHFKLWEKPSPASDYFMTIDSAGGLKQSQIESKREPDPSCIDVWNHYTGKQVAQWHGHIDYDMIGDLAEMIGKLFNKCIACVELNNHGYTVAADLARKHYPQFEMKPGEPGWQSNRKTKPRAVDDLTKLSRDGFLQIMCKQTVEEMRTFVEEGGKYNAASGCHDERVDTASMAASLMTMLPRRIQAPSATLQRGRGAVNWRRRTENRKKSGRVKYRTPTDTPAAQYYYT